MNHPFLQQLRERTADWHARLEQNLLSVKLMSNEVSTNDYAKYLSALFGFVTGFEKYIESELQSFIPDLPERKKTAMITQDLVLLGKNMPELETLPESYFHAMYTDPYAALGAFYVMEGSVLGGQVIQKHLHQQLGEEAGKVSYLNAYREKTGAMWKPFLENLCAVAEKSGKQENIIDGALRTYRLLDQLMTDESVKA